MVSFPLYLGSCFTPFRVFWFSLEACFCGLLEIKDMQVSLRGKSGEGSLRLKDLRGSWKFSLKMQINGKEIFG